MCLAKGICSTEDEVYPEQVFEEFDYDNNKMLAKEEFAVIYYFYCQECEQSLDDVFALFDKNSDSLLSIEEFKKLFCEVNGYCGCDHDENENQEDDEDNNEDEGDKD